MNKEYHCSTEDMEIIAYAMLRYLHATQLPPSLKYRYEALYLRLAQAESVMVSGQ